ncbi:MAG: S1C family serine protease [Candidatus Gastranaerophilaceae bacterium]
MKKLIISFAVLAQMTLLNAGAQSFAPDEALNVMIYEKINPSTVFIEALSDGEISSGTGIIIDKNGTIVTGSHVIEGDAKIEVTTASGKTYDAKVLYKPKDQSDLIVIGIKPKERLESVTLGDSSTVKVGQKVLAVGNPFGFKGTLTTGIISRIDYVRNKIQTDAAINPGSSGGPVVNTGGEVIGISQSIYNPDNNRSNIGIGFAVPVNEVKKVLNAYAKIKPKN